MTIETPEPNAGAGKIALVTGANTGIGFAAVKGLATLGFTTLLGARDQERGEAAVVQLKEMGLNVELCLLDLADHDSIAQAATSLSENYGRLDVLINNAGMKAEFYPESATPSQASLHVLEETLRINVVGTAAVIQAMLPLLHNSEAGRIINLSSGLGSLTWAKDPEMGYQRVSLLGYCTSKAALNMLTVQFSNELRDSAITVNAVDPGSVATPMNPRATRLPDDAIAPLKWLATRGTDCPTGAFFDERGEVPW